ncbi:pantothenate synthetase [Bacteroidales bacterium]|nr:pantothenate synthetase [Bacteroidales bacterium]
MQVVKSIIELQSLLDSYRLEGKSIGLVPTMGALHNGHLSLVDRCKQLNDICVVSIFVNPIQFNDSQDLINYPRTEESDCRQLETIACDCVFIPEIKEIYPEPDNRQFDFGILSQVMEGAFREGHFNGVAQVVSKLFCIVGPDNAYFGEKDFQQLVIIRAMVKYLDLATTIISCPIVREIDGLAMSSRNMRIVEEVRPEACEIYKTLQKSQKMAFKHSVGELKEMVIATLALVKSLRLEYFEIVDGYSLQAISDWSQTEYPVACIAVFCGEVRLIDNIAYKIKD